jgi:hypothetical protein
MNWLVKQLDRWVYPANQPSVVPFVVRRVVADVLLYPAFVAVWRCAQVVKRWGSP